MIEVASERENNSNIVTYLYGVLTMAQALSNSSSWVVHSVFATTSLTFTVFTL